MSVFKRMLTLSAQGLFLLSVFAVSGVSAQNPFTSITSTDQLRDRMVGYGVTDLYINSHSSIGVGLVNNLNEALIPFTNGVFLSTGNPSEEPAKILGANDMLRHGGTDTISAMPSGFFDTNGVSVAKNWATQLYQEHNTLNFHDPAYIMMRLMPQGNVLSVKYALISEEYYRSDRTAAGYPNTDVFAFFVSLDNGTTWTNLSRIVSQDGASVPAGIKTVNELTNSTYFVANVVTNELGAVTKPGGSDPYNTPDPTVTVDDFPLALKCNGAIVSTTSSLRVRRGNPVLLMVLIADQFNAAADSTLLIDGAGITSGADIRVALAADPVTTNYTLTVSNPGPVDATDIAVTNWFPAGLTLVSTACTANVEGWQTFGGTNVFTVKSLPRGASETVTFYGTGSVSGSFTNSAVAWPSEGDYAPGDNTAEAALTLEFGGTPVLAVEKRVTDGVVPGDGWTLRGTNLTYVITVTNQGDAATGSWTLEVTDTLPAGVTPAAGSATGWTLDALAPGAFWSTDLTVTVDADAPCGSLTNRCELVIDAAGINSNLTAECVTPIRPEADVAVWLSASTNRIGLPPRTHGYTVTVSNAGPCRATAVTVALDPAPAGLTLTPNAAELGPFDLEAGAVRVIAVPAEAELSLSGSVTNRVTVNGAVYDPDPANNEALAEVLFDPVTDVAVGVAWLGAPGPVAGNAPAGFSVTVTNRGPAAASDVSLTLSGALTDTVALGALSAGNFTNLVFWRQADEGAPTLHAQADVVAAEPDAVPGNNTAAADIPVLWPNVKVGLTDVPDPVVSAGTLTYVLSVSNQWAAVTGIVAELTLPPEVTAVLSDAGGAAIPGGLRFGPLDFAAGEGTNWSVEVRAPTVAADTEITAAASATVPFGDVNPSDNVAAAATLVLPPPRADLQAGVAWLQNPVAGGTNDTYRFAVAVTNLNAANTATNVAVEVWLAEAPALLTAPPGWVGDGALTARLAAVIGSLPPSGATGAVFDVRLSGVAASVTAHVRARSDNDDNEANNAAQDTVAVAWPDAAVTLASVPASVVSEGAFAYELSVTAITAAGPDLAVTVQLPAAFLVTDAAGGATVPGGLRFGPFSLPEGAVTNWSIGVKAPSVEAVQTFSATATLEPALGDTDGSNDSAEAQTTVTLPPMADVAAFVLWQDTALHGSTHTAYGLYAAVTNTSPDTAATNVTLRVFLAAAPATLTLPPEGWQVTGPLTAELAQVVGSLPPGAGTGAWFSVTLTDVAHLLTATAQTASGNDLDAGNNRASATANVLWPDLRVTLTPGAAQLTEGDALDYVLTVANSRPVPVAGVWVTNAFPSFVTVTNAGGGVVADGTNVCFTGLNLAAEGSTSMTVRVHLDSLPEGVTALVATAACTLPPGDLTPGNNGARSEIPAFRRSHTAEVTWVLCQQSGVYYARLTLSNTSVRRIDSVWFAFADRFVTDSDGQLRESSLWRMPENRKVSERFADGARYVDLTAALQAALVAAGGDAFWDPGETVAIGVTQETLARYDAHNGISSVPVPERILAMYNGGRINPSEYVDLRASLGSRAGSFRHDSGLDSDGDFTVSAGELDAARLSWQEGTLSDEEYLFLSAASRAAGYRWDTERRQWVVVE